MTWILLKLAIRFAVYGLVFGGMAWRYKPVRVHPRYALPLVAAVFALLNTGLYWLLKPVLNLATLGTLAFFMPVALNLGFLYVTERVLKPLRIEGIWPMFVMSVVLTVAHGLLWVGLDYISW